MGIITETAPRTIELTEFAAQTEQTSYQPDRSPNKKHIGYETILSSWMFLITSYTVGSFAKNCFKLNEKITGEDHLTFRQESLDIIIFLTVLAGTVGTVLLYHFDKHNNPHKFILGPMRTGGALIAYAADMVDNNELNAKNLFIIVTAVALAISAEVLAAKYAPPKPPALMPQSVKQLVEDANLHKQELEPLSFNKEQHSLNFGRGVLRANNFSSLFFTINRHLNRQALSVEQKYMLNLTLLTGGMLSLIIPLDSRPYEHFSRLAESVIAGALSYNGQSAIAALMMQHGLLATEAADLLTGIFCVTSTALAVYIGSAQQFDLSGQYDANEKLTKQVHAIAHSLQSKLTACVNSTPASETEITLEQALATTANNQARQHWSKNFIAGLKTAAASINIASCNNASSYDELTPVLAASDSKDYQSIQKNKSFGVAVY